MRLFLALAAAMLLLGCAGVVPGGNETTGCACGNETNEVCGSDNVTYANECYARCAHVNATAQGACPSCTDTDGGNNASVKGTVTIDINNYTDYCVVFWSVEEYYCKGAIAGRETVPCGEGFECKDGACIAKTPAPPEPECIDSDAKDIYTKGYVNTSAYSYVDSCSDYKAVKEYFCKEGEAKSEITECPHDYKCLNGRCAKPEMNCTDTDSGNDIYSGGKVTVVIGLTSAEYIDKCVDGSSVKEYYCEPDGYVGETVHCPQGYRCVEASCKQYACSDTDNGYSIFQQGAVNKGDDIFRDECLDAHGGVEYYCDDNTVMNATFECPASYSCDNGRCEG